ncbi:MAG TPA: metalloregulator ArsR/SmtB family transcription factor [Tepidisphaeraceae bacterium]|nr:metalloregulator ArsR/SmtB family transcription factor [Tepidisphaeraceae bacterium]
MAKSVRAVEVLPGEFESVAQLFSVLADSTRLMILYQLKQRPAYVSELCKRTGLKQPNLSKHLAMLYQAGLVKKERNGNHIRYSIGDALVFDLCDLVCRKLHRTAQTQAELLRRVSA